VSCCFHYYVVQVRHGFRSLLRTLARRFPSQVSRHWNRTELVTCATVRVLYPIRILSGAPESMMKILSFCSGLLGHCQDNYVTTVLPSRLQHVPVLTSHSTPHNWCSCYSTLKRSWPTYKGRANMNYNS